MSPERGLEQEVADALTAYVDSWTPDVNASADRLERRLMISRQRSRVALVSAAILALVVGAGVAEVLHRAVPPAGHTPNRVIPVTPRGATSTDLGSGPLRAGVHGRTAWVATAAGELVAVDTSSGAIRGRTQLPSSSPGSAFDVEPVAGSVWVSERFSNLVVAVDRSTGRVVHRIRTTGDRGPFGMTVAGQTLWATAGDRLLEIDATTGAVTRRVQLPHGCRSYDVAVADGAVWVTDVGPPYRLLRYDQSTHQVTAVPLPGSPAGLAASDGSLWVGLAVEPWLVRVDAESGTVAGRVRLPGPPLAVTASTGSVWVGVPLRGEVDQVDTRQRRVVRRWVLGSYPPFALAAQGQLFVTSNQSDELIRVPLP